MINKLLLIRGLPGSGKSTLAKQMHGYVHIETDMFFTEDGKYEFDRYRIREAHEWCQRQVYTKLELGHNVVVSNTFTELWEMSPYFEMAERLEVNINVILCQGAFQNVHNVPVDVYQRMRDRFDFNINPCLLYGTRINHD